MPGIEELKAINFDDSFYHLHFGFELIFGNMIKQEINFLTELFSLSLLFLINLKHFGHSRVRKHFMTAGGFS